MAGFKDFVQQLPETAAVALLDVDHLRQSSSMVASRSRPNRDGGDLQRVGGSSWWPARRRCGLGSGPGWGRWAPPPYGCFGLFRQVGMAHHPQVTPGGRQIRQEKPGHHSDHRQPPGPRREKSATRCEFHIAQFVVTPQGPTFSLGSGVMPRCQQHDAVLDDRPAAPPRSAATANQPAAGTGAATLEHPDTSSKRSTTSMPWAKPRTAATPEPPATAPAEPQQAAVDRDGEALARTPCRPAHAGPAAVWCTSMQSPWAEKRPCLRRGWCTLQTPAPGQIRHPGRYGPAAAMFMNSAPARLLAMNAG